MKNMKFIMVNEYEKYEIYNEIPNKKYDLL